MKKIMFALCFMFGGIVVLSAQDTQDTTSNQYRTETQSQYPQDLGQQQDRERIQSTELPDEVKRALEGEEYRGWLISGAFKSQASAEQSMGADTTGTDPNQQGTANARVEEGEDFFTVELKNGAETKTVHFKSDGQILEGMDDGENSPANPYTPGDQMNQNDRMNQDPNDPNNRNNQYNQDNRYNQNQDNPNNQNNNQYNQNDPLNQQDPTNQTTPPEQTLPGDPNATDQPDQSGQSQSSDPSQTDPSTGTPTPGTQPDQPRTDGPK